MAPIVEVLTIPAWHAFQAVASFPFALFLDSALQHPTLGRYSYVTADPFAVLWCRQDRVNWLRQSSWSPPSEGTPFELLQRSLEHFRASSLAGLPPFQGGIAGLFGYDLCYHLEELPRPRVDEFEVPDLAVGFYDWVYAFDHLSERGWLISTGVPETN